MAHVLVVGSTSRLREVVRFLAERNNLVTVMSYDDVDFSQNSLSALEGIEFLTLKESDKPRISEILHKNFQSFGPATLAVVWNSSGWEGLEETVASALNDHAPICRFFHVEKEQPADGDPGREAVNEHLTHNYERVLYRKVVLRYSEGPFGQMNGLVMNQVTEGVISAIRDDSRFRLIGSEGTDLSEVQTA